MKLQFKHIVVILVVVVSIVVLIKVLRQNKEGMWLINYTDRRNTMDTCDCGKFDENRVIDDERRHVIPPSKYY